MQEPPSEQTARTALRHGMQRPLIVVGITHPQTCVVVASRYRAFREAGFRVVLVASPGPMLEQLAAEEGLEPIAIPMRRGIAPIHDLISLIRLWRMLRRLRPEVTEFSTPKAGLLGNMAAFFSRVPVRVYLLRGLRLETISGIQRRILTIAEQLAARCSHFVLCNSKSLLVEALGLSVSSEKKLKLIGNGSSHGVDFEHFAPGPSTLRQRLRIPDHVPVIGFVGRLTRDKGVPELMEAFDSLLKIVPQAQLLLVGWFDASEDALNGELQAYIRSHPNVICTGFVKDTAPWYRAMDMMVLPTWREGFPNAVLEAAASEIPVITTLATGARDAVVPEVTGLLIPPGHPEAICEAILDLLRDETRRRAMGVAARQWVIENFSEEQVLRSTVSYYRNLLLTCAQPAPALATRDVSAGAE
jgi:glycosyltransferase involved in cell wall biosynthesis